MGQLGKTAVAKRPGTSTLCGKFQAKAGTDFWCGCFVSPAVNSTLEVKDNWKLGPWGFGSGRGSVLDPVITRVRQQRSCTKDILPPFTSCQRARSGPNQSHMQVTGEAYKLARPWRQHLAATGLLHTDRAAGSKVGRQAEKTVHSSVHSVRSQLHLGQAPTTMRELPAQRSG